MNDKKLTAKQYLDQLRVIDTKINQKMEELADLMTTATSTGAIDYSKDRVQTSPQNAQENRICKYVDLDAEINREIDEFVDIKHRVTKEIQELNVDYYIKILFKVYVQYKTVKDAANEIGLSYQYVRDLHKKALEAFEELHTDLHYLT
jgi:DNA-directed RNA polymerase specialized sigma subunit